jgi:Predicted transcriptional regulator
MPLEEAIKEGIRESLKKSFKKRRGRLEIIADILSVAKDGAKKTEIVYRANLNFNRVENYLPYLAEKELIEDTAEGGYKTTEKGNEFLSDYKKMKEHLII